MPERTFVFAGNWAYSNLGCEAIVRGTAHLLRAEVGDCRFVSQYFTEEVCPDEQRETDPQILHRPFPYLKRYSPEWVKHQFEKRCFQQLNSTPVLNAMHQSIRETDAVLFLGGDTFSPDYGNADDYFELSSLVVKAHVPVTIWGASIGPFKGNPAYEQKVAQKLREITLLCVRETETLAYLNDLGVKENVLLTADPSFYLPPSPCPLPDEVETALKNGCIGINLSPILQRYIFQDHSGRPTQNKLAMWTQIAAEIVCEIRHRFSQPVLLIPHVFSECRDIGRDDFLFLQAVKKQLAGMERSENVLLLAPGLNAGQTKYVISRLHAFAGARTHATLAAISTGVPTIFIGYSMKSRGIAKDVYGHLDWLVSGNDLVKTPSILCDRLASLLNHEVPIRSHIERIQPVFRQRARNGARRFLDLVERNGK